MTLLLATKWLLGASFALWALLTFFVVVRKYGRDRREARSTQRRALLERLARDGDVDELAEVLRPAARDLDAQVDVDAAIARVRPDLNAYRLARVRAAAHASGLESALVDQLGDRDPVARGEAALVLARLGHQLATHRIAGLLSDRDPDVRLAACRALALLATQQGAEALIAALAERQMPPERIVERLAAPWALQATLDALANATSSLPVEAPARGAGRAIPFRASLARALGLVGDPRAGSALLQLLRGGSEEEQVNAARALGEVGSDEAPRALVDALGSASWPVRAQAATALGALGSSEAVPALAECLGDGAWWVRANAAGALRALGPSGLNALRQALDSEDRYARERAGEALALEGLRTGAAA
ncbi:MAG: hypothetical protein QOJ55_2675 [Solirubrobacteraceae bacterium]|nr:hypothetical protein [Solirubrobacteraceae bacterium]MDX6672653.1 hypothetical protein [Solirubrobacteraceae bacterium]